MTALLLGILATSLAGSLHCVGMCGGLVALAATGRKEAQLAYQAGRLLAYVALGALAGGLGDAATHLSGWPRAAAVGAGVTMALLGLATLLRAAGVAVPRLPLARWLAPTPWGLVLARTRTLHPLVRAAVLGTASALLPCGWLYAFVLAAAGTGSAWHGGLVLAAFWAGSVPALLAVGWLGGHAGRALRQKAPLAAAVALVALGTWTATRRLPVPTVRLAQAQDLADLQRAGVQGAVCHDR